MKLNTLNILCVLVMFYSQQLFAVELNGLLDLIEKRSQFLENSRSYKVHAKSIMSEMDGNWKANKITTNDKIVTRIDSTYTTEILSSTIAEKGETKDNTENAIKELNENRNKGMSFKGKDFFPFATESRKKYEISIIADSTIDEQKVHVLRCTAKEKSEKLYDGDYYIDSSDYTLLGFSAIPSKNPKMVKDMQIKMNFGINESNVYAVKRFEMKTHVKVLIKNFRFQLLETYKNYEYLD